MENTCKGLLLPQCKNFKGGGWLIECLHPSDGWIYDKEYDHWRKKGNSTEWKEGNPLEAIAKRGFCPLFEARSRKQKIYDFFGLPIVWGGGIFLLVVAIFLQYYLMSIAKSGDSLSSPPGQYFFVSSIICIGVGFILSGWGLCYARKNLRYRP